jgi:hypothetical protein
MGIMYVENQARRQLTSKQSESVEIVRRVCDCFVATHWRSLRLQNSQIVEVEANETAARIIEAAFRRSGFNSLAASRLGLEAVIKRLNEEFNFSANTELLAEHNATLRQIIGDLQPTVTLI